MNERMLRLLGDAELTEEQINNVCEVFGYRSSKVFFGGPGAIVDTYRSDAQWMSPANAIDELVSTAELAKNILGISFQFPSVEIDNESLGLFAETTVGNFEGVVDLTFSIQIPAKYGEGIFAKKDGDGRSFSDLIGDRIPLWKLRINPDTPNPHGVRLEATQRFIGLEDTSVSNYSCYFLRYFKPTNQERTIEQQIEAYGKSFRNPHFEPVPWEVPRDIHANNVYLLWGLAGNQLIERIEKRIKLHAEEFFTLLGIWALQSNGYHQIRAVKDEHQMWLRRHPREGKKWMGCSFNYDELWGKYFEYNPRFTGDKYSWLLHHHGNNLGVSRGMAFLTPQFVRYATQGNLTSTSPVAR